VLLGQKHQNDIIWFANYQSDVEFYFFTKMDKSCHMSTIS